MGRIRKETPWLKVQNLLRHEEILRMREVRVAGRTGGAPFLDLRCSGYAIDAEDV